MTKRRKRHFRVSSPAAARQPQGVPLMTTPEGDPMVFARALYRHDAAAGIRQQLMDAADFDCDETRGPGGSYQAAWLKTGAAAPTVPSVVGQRILATLTLTPTALEVETISQERLLACQRRLTRLLGDRIEFVATKTKTVDQVLREPSPEPMPEPFIPPPELVAEMEERMLQQWVDSSIPALGGLTPREAVKTAEGWQQVLDLIDYIEGEQAQRGPAPGIFSPDYRKAKKLLGLE
jgi:hypothetical protein